VNDANSVIQPTTWSTVLEKLIVNSARQEITFLLYEIRRLITAFKRACHWSLSWARYMQSTPSQP